jgi:hypothetical protein
MSSASRPRLSSWYDGFVFYTRGGELSRIRRDYAASEASARFVVQRLKERRPPIESVAASGIGTLGYYLDVRLIDLLGLTEPAVARRTSSAPAAGLSIPGHQRSNTAYVLQQRPTCILVGQKGRGLPLPAVVDIWNDPGFERDYVWDARCLAYCRRNP